MISPIIEAVNLTKIYHLKGKKREVRALDKLNLSINKGEIFGLLGPNGAGKTTFIQVLTTARAPTSGEVYIDGFNLLTNRKQAKSYISIMLGSSMSYAGLTGYHNLKFYAKIYKVKNYQQKIDVLARKFEMKFWLDQRVFRYSSGMRVKLALIRTLLLDRPLLLLDEPARGLDVKSKALMIDVFKNMNKTILITSHNMDLIEQLCNRIAFINKGKIIKVGTTEDIKKLTGSGFQFEVKVEKDVKQLLLELKNIDYVKNIEGNNKKLKIEIEKRYYYNDIISILTKYRILMIKEHVKSLSESFKKIV